MPYYVQEACLSMQRHGVLEILLLCGPADLVTARYPDGVELDSGAWLLARFLPDGQAMDGRMARYEGPAPELPKSEDLAMTIDE